MPASPSAHLQQPGRGRLKLSIVDFLFLKTQTENARASFWEERIRTAFGQIWMLRFVVTVMPLS
ncbi:hypothetical protein TRICHSKD4_1456 [Roseibium sp. TrichSKD4]|nr:hypothetical protein TRICHSKD4_1456 [Roseibium sp. TrichSKD4]